MQREDRLRPRELGQVTVRAARKDMR